MVRVRLGEELLEDSETEGREGVLRGLEEHPLGELQERVDFALKFSWNEELMMSKVVEYKF